MAGSGADGTTVCPFASKWARNRRLISAVFIAGGPPGNLSIADPRVLPQLGELVVVRLAAGEGLVDLLLTLGHADPDVVHERPQRLDQTAGGLGQPARDARRGVRLRRPGGLAHHQDAHGQPDAQPEHRLMLSSSRVRRSRSAAPRLAARRCCLMVSRTSRSVSACRRRRGPAHAVPNAATLTSGFAAAAETTVARFATFAVTFCAWLVMVSTLASCRFTPSSEVCTCSSATLTFFTVVFTSPSSGAVRSFTSVIMRVVASTVCRSRRIGTASTSTSIRNAPAAISAAISPPLTRMSSSSVSRDPTPRNARPYLPTSRHADPVTGRGRACQPQTLPSVMKVGSRR